VEREESDLYGLPLDEFVPKRTELEKRLRKEGDRERAAAVKQLPKPSVAAWAVNQASRCRPKERGALLEASGELRDVQERLLAGDASAADLEKAVAKQREAIDGLVEAAAGLLTSEGRSMGDATLARARETFAAVATDPELAELVEAGTLDRERQANGLGLGGLAAAEPAAASRGGKGRRAGSGSAKGGSAKGAKGGSAKAAKGASKGSSGKAERGSAKAARREAAERKRREKEARAARERVKAARKGEREAARRLEAAERDARKAAKELEKRERDVEAARARAETAREELDEATRQAG
jgi:hypothetical protein